MPLTDGQSGYRALSRAAAAEAVVEHDFNYAQVLTLDLLARGFRYREVPISYASASRAARSCGSAGTCGVSSPPSGGWSTARPDRATTARVRTGAPVGCGA